MFSPRRYLQSKEEQGIFFPSDVFVKVVVTVESEVN